MGQRQIRFRGEQLNPKALGLYKGSFVEVILLAGQTYSGILEVAQNETITVRDINARWYNRASHRHSMPYASVLEVSVRINVPY